MRKRIVFFDVRSWGTGSILSLKAILALLNRSIYEPVIWFGSKADAETWSGEQVVWSRMLMRFANSDFHPVIFDLRGFRHCIGALLRLILDFPRIPIMLRRLKPDLIHLNQETGLSVGICAKWMGIPVVWHIRGLICDNWIGHLQDRLYAYCSDQIIAISDTVVACLPYSEKQGKVVRLYDAIGVIDPPSKQLQDDFRSQFGLRKDCLIVLLLGTLSAQKGYGFLAEVADQLSESKVQFVLAGKLPGNPPKDKQMIIEQWNPHVESGRAVFTGHVDAATAISVADLVVCPNLVKEALGRTVIEAYALGTPVLAMNIFPFIETIIDNQTGWLLPADPLVWADKLKVLEQNRDSIPRLSEGITRQLARFDDQQYMRDLELIYTRLLDNDE